LLRVLANSASARTAFACGLVRLWRAKSSVERSGFCQLMNDELLRRGHGALAGTRTTNLRGRWRHQPLAANVCATRCDVNAAVVMGAAACQLFQNAGKLGQAPAAWHREMCHWDIVSAVSFWWYQGIVGVLLPQVASHMAQPCGSTSVSTPKSTQSHRHHWKHELVTMMSCPANFSVGARAEAQMAPYYAGNTCEPWMARHGSHARPAPRHR